MAPKWLDRREQASLLKELERGRAAARSEFARWKAIRDQAIVQLLLNTGLRIGELCALETDDLELSERKGTLKVHAGKGQKARTIPLNKSARDAIAAWLKISQQSSDIRVGLVNGQPVFIGKRGDALEPSAIQRTLAEYGRRAGVEVTPHVLRHSFAKNLVDAGVSLEKVAALLGHSSLNTTRVYVTPGQSDLDQAVHLVDN